MVTLPSLSLISKTTALPPTSRQRRMMRMPWSLAAMIPVRYMARTSKSRATGTDFSTIGMGSSPGNDHRLAGLQECASEISVGARGSPRSVLWKSSTKSATDNAGPPAGCCRRAWLHKVRCPAAPPRSGDGSGALGASGVEGREVRNNLGFAVWAEAGGTAAGRAKSKEINRMASERCQGPMDAK